MPAFGRGIAYTPAIAVGTVLAQACYAPGSATVTSTTSTTHADIDATNLLCTFTAPPSGNVTIEFSAVAQISSALYNYLWGVRESTTLVAKSVVTIRGSGGSTGYVGATRKSYVSGLTAGQVYAWKWTHAVSNAAATGTHVMGTAANADGAVMTVKAA